MIKYLYIILLSGLLHSCYTFTGASLDKNVKTIQINEFMDNSPLKNPTLAQRFSIDIQNRFLQRTTLKSTKNNPDILIEGEIVEYTPTMPVSVSSNAITNNTGGLIQTSQNKMVIRIKVHYENKIEPQKNFDRTYSDEAVYSSELSINQIEDEQTKIVIDRIINKIFNDIIADW